MAHLHTCIFMLKRRRARREQKMNSNRKTKMYQWFGWFVDHFAAHLVCKNENDENSIKFVFVVLESVRARVCVLAELSWLSSRFQNEKFSLIYFVRFVFNLWSRSERQPKRMDDPVQWTKDITAICKNHKLYDWNDFYSQATDIDVARSTIHIE